MKKSFKKFGVSLCLLASLGLVAGCGGNNNDKGNADNQQADNQGNDKIITVGILQFADHPSLDNCREGFIQGLADSGFVEGKNLKLEYNNAMSDTGTTAMIANQYVSNNVDLICAIATPAAQAAFNAAEPKDIPVVYTAISDPIAAKLADESGVSGKNVTGTSDRLPLEQQVAMIRELLPEAKTIGIIYSTSEANSESQIAQLEEIVPNYGFTLETVGINAQGDVPMAADNILTKVDCINNLTDNTVVSALSVIIEKANEKGIPVFGSEEEQLKSGCIASESIDYVALGKKTGEMAAKVLNGEDISAMPYETITDFEQVVNQTAMELLKVSLPESMSEARVVNTQAEEKE